MVTLRIDATELVRLGNQLSQFSDRRLKAAVATALTRTAVEIKNAARRDMARVFDRPKPYTLNSLFTSPATAAKLQAVTFIKDDGSASNAGTPPVKYLLPGIEGGARRQKRYEAALVAAGALPAGWVTTPGAGARLDAYGNVSVGQIIQILSQLRITQVSGLTRNLSFDARKQARAQKKAGGRFFVARPGNTTVQPGIYQREFVGRNITPVLIFVKGANYKKRFDFFGIGQRVVASELKPQIDRAVREQMARLLAKRRSGA